MREFPWAVTRMTFPQTCINSGHFAFKINLSLKRYLKKYKKFDSEYFARDLTRLSDRTARYRQVTQLQDLEELPPLKKDDSVYCVERDQYYLRRYRIAKNSLRREKHIRRTQILTSRALILCVELCVIFRDRDNWCRLAGSLKK